MRQLLRRVWFLLRQRRQDDELMEEIEFHRAMRQRELEAGGLAPAEAALATQRALGNVPLARNHARDVWIGHWYQGLAQDVRLALRLLIKDRGFTAAALIALALGMGISSTVFTVVNGFTRGLPVQAPDRIVGLRAVDRRAGPLGVSRLDFTDWRAAAPAAFADMAIFAQSAMTLRADGAAAGDPQPIDRLRGAYVASQTFRLLGETPLIGRDFLPEDDRPGAPAVVLLGYDTWTARYAADPGIIGRTLIVNQRPATVVGVMRAGNQFPSLEQIWQPLAQMPDVAAQPRDARTLQAFGRLADGVTRAQADAAIAAIAARLALAHPQSNRDIGAGVTTFPADGPAGLTLALMAAVGCVLLIACANVANLLLARSARRAREMAIRTSLGATRARLIHQLLIESLVLASVAGLLGFGLSFLGVRLFALGVAGINLPYYIQWTMDARVFTFVAAACLGTGLVFGLVPAWHVSKTKVEQLLKDGGRTGANGRRARRWSSVMLAAELALTLVLLAGGTMTMRSFLALQQADRVIDPRPLLTMGLALPGEKYRAPEQRAALFAQVEERLRGNGGIASATVASNLPFIGAPLRQVIVEGRAGAAAPERSPACTVAIGTRYFETMGLRLLRGRSFDDADGTAGRASVIVNERFAAAHFSGSDPIGRRIQLVDPSAARGKTATLASGDAPWLTIVGVSPTVRQHFIGDISPVAYLPYRAAPALAMSVIARGRGVDGDPAELTAALRKEIGAIDDELQVHGVMPMERAVVQSRWIYRVFGGLFAAFGGIALGLSALGLYAVTAYGVSQRTQEIGLRMALGARDRQVVWLFVRRAMAPLGVGLAIGLAGAYGIGRVLAGLLVGTSAGDPITLGGIALLLVAVAVVACLVPARRAARLDPLASLRYE